MTPKQSEVTRAAGAAEEMIALTIEGPVAVATLARAPVNAIDPAWLARLDEVVRQVRQCDDVSVLHVRSRLAVFCAGADLGYLHTRFGTPQGRAEIIDFTARMQAVYAALEALEIVTLAEIGGAAMGGGLELALACDLRAVAHGAKLGLPEARLGLLPAAGGTQRLTRLCGEGVARRLILGAEVIGGDEAVAVRLAHWQVPVAELPEFARATAQRLGALPRGALAHAKHCVAAALDPACDGYARELAASAALLATPDTQQRVREFLEGRR